MPPANKQTKHCRSIARSEVHQTPVENNAPTQPQAKINPKNMVISALVNGMGYEEQRRAADITNIQVPSSATFYRAQRQVLPQVHEMARRTCDTYAKTIKDGNVITSDACWNHVRNGSAATVSLIDQNQKKVVAYTNVTKTTKRYSGNFVGASNNMESFGTREALNALQPNLQNKTIQFAHDHDNRTGTIIKESGINATETYDPGHACQEFNRKAKSYFNAAAQEIYYQKNNKESPIKKAIGGTGKKGMKAVKAKGKDNPYTMKKCHSIFAVLFIKLSLFFKYLIFNVEDPEVRAKMWENSENHFIGNHQNCVHPSEMSKGKVGRPKKSKSKKEEFWEWEEGKKDPSILEYLHNFLTKITPFVKKVGKNRTQQNESLNAKIAQTRPKNKAFSTSNAARAEIAIGQQNDPHFVSNLINKISPNSVCPQCMSSLRRSESMRFYENQTRRTDSAKQKKNILRIQERQTHKESSKSGYKDKKSPFINLR